MVPNFTGRQSEVEEIIGHVTSESTRLVSIWGSPGFGKTSVAIAVGHALQTQGLPMYWVSLRGLQSKAGLTSKILSLLTQPTIQEKQPFDQRLSLDDKICQLFSEISKQSAFILDNADDLLESGRPKVKEEVMQLLEEILRQNPRVTFIVTTRESLEFMDVHFQGHRGLRIGKLCEASAQTLIHELLPHATVADCRKIAQLCGQVPLAIKLLCSLISEDSTSPRHFLDNFMTSSSESIVQMLDNQDYPTSHRLKFVFDSSFQRLSEQEQKSLISLSILPENFSTEVAAAVLNKKTAFEAKRILQNLRRKSLIDSGSKPGTFTMHKLLQSFSREKGDSDMKKTILNAKGRLNAFYVSHFDELNEQFLTGHSLAAYVAFYEDKDRIIQSLIEGCFDSKTADSVFQILVKGELFLDSLFWSGGKNFLHIYDTAIKAANLHGKEKYHRQLLSSKAFGEVTWGRTGQTNHLLSEVKQKQAASSDVSKQEKGKSVCYLGIFYLTANDSKSGVQCLKEALSSLENCKDPESLILKLLIFQILACYYEALNDFHSAGNFYFKSLHLCSAVGDWKLLIIPPRKSKAKDANNEIQVGKKSETLLNEPLEFHFAFLLSKATEFFSDAKTKQCTSNSVLQMLECVEKEVKISLGLLMFHRAVVQLLCKLKSEGPVNSFWSGIKYHEKTLEQCQESFLTNDEYGSNRYSQIQTEALVKCYIDLGKVYQQEKNYSEALQSNRRALDIAIRFFGEEHESTADSYRQLGVTQNNMHDYSAALQSHQHALAIRIKLFGEEHESTADSYRELGVTQYNMHDYSAALQSLQHALAIRIKRFGEEHKSTADSYRELGVTQNNMHDYSAALQSHQHALAMRIKLFGEEHKSTADSYSELGATQYNMHDYSAALQSEQHALAIRIKLFGEEHESTADSYSELGATQYNMHDYSAALQSEQHALAIRIKLFGEEHESTADSYRQLGVTQNNMHDYSAALQSHQRALTIRLKLFGEDHESTADSYRQLGVTQYNMHDYSAALQSHQRALAIRDSSCLKE